MLVQDEYPGLRLHVHAGGAAEDDVAELRSIFRGLKNANVRTSAGVAACPHAGLSSVWCGI